jgi:hypothetical protein
LQGGRKHRVGLLDRGRRFWGEGIRGSIPPIGA